jgi:hypothetical protein
MKIQASKSFNNFQLKEFSSKTNPQGKISYCLKLMVDDNDSLCVKAFQKEFGGEWNVRVKEPKKEGLNLGKEEKLEREEELGKGESNIEEVERNLRKEGMIVEKGGIIPETQGQNLEREERPEKFEPEQSSEKSEKFGQEASSEPLTK